jgi:hypothetical protein
MVNHRAEDLHRSFHEDWAFFGIVDDARKICDDDSLCASSVHHFLESPDLPLIAVVWVLSELSDPDLLLISRPQCVVDLLLDIKGFVEFPLLSADDLLLPSGRRILLQGAPCLPNEVVSMGSVL